MKDMETEHTYTDGYDADHIYRIRHLVNGECVDVVSAGELEHRLRFALEHWTLTAEQRTKVMTWLEAYRPKKKKSDGLGRSRETTRRMTSRR